MTETLPLNDVQMAILDALIHARADWPLPASALFDRCDEADSIQSVNTALHVLHKRGYVDRELVQPDKGRPRLVYWVPDPPAPDPDHVPAAGQMAPPIDADSVIATQPAALLAAATAGDEFGSAVPDLDAALVAALSDLRDPDPILTAIESLPAPRRECLTDRDRVRLRALSGWLAQSDRHLGRWLSGVCDALESAA